MTKFSIFDPLLPLFSGLGMTQAIAWLHVYQANAVLHHDLMAIQSHGYIPVPNAVVLPTLLTFKTGAYGGLFFTLSLGAGLSLASFIAARLWCVRRSGPGLAGLIALWGLLLLAVNSDGFGFYRTLYIWVVPPVVTGVSLWRYPEPRPLPWRRLGWPLMVLVILAGTWSYNLDQNLFTDFRDQVLLAGQPGISITRWYYRYTLYAAEIIKPLVRRQVKPCSLSQISDQRLQQQISTRLRMHDYLEIPDTRQSCLDVRQAESGDLVFTHAGKPALTVEVSRFMAQPAATLSDFSKRSDSNAVFRKLIFIGLVLGLPLVLFMVLHCCLAGLGAFFLPERAAALASVVCLAAGLGLLYPVIQVRSLSPARPSVNTLLTSPQSSERMAALRAIERQKLDITRLPSYNHILKSSKPAERARLARCLRYSPGEKAYHDLLALLEDPDALVTCAVLWSLGHRKDHRAIGRILDVLNTSHHWYVQWYAYNSLKSLGWTQKPSI